jgi:hypothetical protein
MRILIVVRKLSGDRASGWCVLRSSKYVKETFVLFLS